uniref:PDZ domain-containing protein n=1 Tax=Angiostrongylus cantonensis TaxID=6313 RepID=A0A0K0DAK7_ANGCA
MHYRKKASCESRDDPSEIPKEYCDTYVVRKPMGARLHKSDCRIVIQLCSAPESSNVQLGLHVKYDARERLQVHNVDYASIAAVHLRPGDVIREVNDKPVASKTMLKYYITEAVVKGRQIRFLVECPSGEAYRDTSDMAPDVAEIAMKQVAS